VSLVADAVSASSVLLTLDGAAFASADTMRWSVQVQADCGPPGMPLWLDFGETALTPRVPAPLNLPFPRDTRAMRVLVREYERRRADGLQREDIVSERTVERLVYSDVVSIGVNLPRA
jgi:hypothetical protein